MFDMKPGFCLENGLLIERDITVSARGRCRILGGSSSGSGQRIVANQRNIIRRGRNGRAVIALQALVD